MATAVSDSKYSGERQNCTGLIEKLNECGPDVALDVCVALCVGGCAVQTVLVCFSSLANISAKCEE